MTEKSSTKSLFVLIAFTGLFSPASLVTITLSAWAFKVGCGGSRASDHAADRELSKAGMSTADYSDVQTDLIRSV